MQYRRQIVAIEELESRRFLSVTDFTFVPTPIECCFTFAVRKAVPADVDQDGDLDIVVPTLGRLHWFENLGGHGNFAPLQNATDSEFWSSDDTRTVIPVDMDNDGDLDLIASAYNSHNTFWLENADGRGWFIPRDTIVESAEPGLSLPADLDGDGDTDVLWVTTSQLSWYENVDNGTFFDRRLIALESETNGVPKLADFDNDGDIDIVIAGRDASIFWFENNGDGHFERNSIRHELLVDRIWLQDFDLDGDIDILAKNRDQSIAWFENEGQGVIGQSFKIVEKGNLQLRAIGDIDGDGDLDLLVHGPYPTSQVSWFENTDLTKLFQPRNLTSSGDTDTVLSLRTIDLVDLDGDQDLDLLVSAGGLFAAEDLDEGSVSWFANDGTGSYLDRELISSRVPQNFAETLDLDSDGDLDILTVSHDGIVSYENRNGTFGNKEIVTRAARNLLGLLDVDRDRDLDLLFFQGGLHWIENLDGRFGDSDELLPNVLQFKVTDLNGDGYDDVLAGTFSGELVWYESIGRNRFTAHEISSGFSRFALDVGDLDADGDLDVVVANTTNNRIDWFENNDGPDRFSSKHSVSANHDSPRVIHIADIDSDANLDILASSSSGPLVLYRNSDGQGDFRFHATVEKPNDLTFVTQIGTIDLDDDGDSDIITPGPYFYENQAGVIGPPTKIDTGILPTLPSAFLLPRNFDDDTMTEMLVVDASSDFIAILERRIIGDINNDRLFNSLDLVIAFQSGEYDDGRNNNSTFESGDWNLDGDFDSSDLVLAFQAGTYVNSALRTQSLVSAAVGNLPYQPIQRGCDSKYRGRAASGSAEANDHPVNICGIPNPDQNV